jgi:hypothetical protein
VVSPDNCTKSNRHARHNNQCAQESDDAGKMLARDPRLQQCAKTSLTSWGGELLHADKAMMPLANAAKPDGAKHEHTHHAWAMP